MPCPYGSSRNFHIFFLGFHKTMHQNSFLRKDFIRISTLSLLQLLFVLSHVICGAVAPRMKAARRVASAGWGWEGTEGFPSAQCKGSSARRCSQVPVALTPLGVRRAVIDGNRSVARAGGDHTEHLYPTPRARTWGLTAALSAPPAVRRHCHRRVPGRTAPN